MKKINKAINWWVSISNEEKKEKQKLHGIYPDLTGVTRMYEIELGKG